MKRSCSNPEADTFNKAARSESGGDVPTSAPVLEGDGNWNVELLASEAEEAFAKVWKNKTACLSTLCKHAQHIERVWDHDMPLRRALLSVLSSSLGSLHNHKEAVLRELSSLAPKITPNATLRHFMTIALPIERQHTRGLRDHEFLVLRADDIRSGTCELPTHPAPESARLPITVVLDNLRSAFNVGSIFRTAECLGVSQMHLCGYTATPDGQTGRAAMGAEANVPWEHSERAHDVVRDLRARGVAVFALETVAEATPVHEVSFPSPCALLLGNERHGLEADLLALCTAPVRIPCRGAKNSMNVGVAFAVCAFEVSRQWTLSCREDVGGE